MKNAAHRFNTLQCKTSLAHGNRTDVVVGLWQHFVVVYRRAEKHQPSQSKVLTWSRFALAFVTLLLPVHAPAEDVPPGETVSNRPRPWAEPLGVRLGGFELFPRIGLEIRHDDNIFARETKQSDVITVVRPDVDLRSDWNNHALRLEAGAEAGRYADSPDEDYYDFRLIGSGRLDIVRESFAEAALVRERSHVPRGSPDEVNGLGPTVFHSSALEGRLFHRFNRLSIDTRLSLERLNFDDVPAAGGIINNDDRDREIGDAAVRTRYTLDERFAPFGEVRLNYRDYTQAVDDDGLNRDSTGYEVLAGTSFDLSGVTFGEVFAGYLRQRFDDRQLDTISGPALGGQLTWTPTGLTTIELGLERTVETTILPGASGILATGRRLRVDHELLRTLILSVEYSRTDDQFKGIAREDTITRTAFGARYLPNRYFDVRLSYEHLQRESAGTDADRDYSSNVVWLRLEIQP